MRFHNIEPNNIENGTGIRTVLWVSGCFHNCKDCHNPSGEEKFSLGTSKLFKHLKNLDFQNPAPFSIKGGDLMELEAILYKFIMFQTDKPLNSINFLSQMGM